MAYTYKYPRPMVTVDAIVFLKEKSKLKVLLIKRKNPPFKNRYAFPGGFIEMEEDLVESAKRELEEETGLKNIELIQFKAFGKPGRDPRGRNISVVFYGFTDINNSIVKASDDATECQWVDTDKIQKMAFDHMEILRLSISELQF
ncbi:MAG: hypothetical protein A2W91_19265 [Bacteroidetes bacterium GWF2_38_335]|nr:MAG: hypothetical protein A2W91_19265 [Bacteroidetes bacterium GWF2_38_335]OFY79899.1 MAG: hypothetical protein A2281_10665 [Bacteroidetes bacterium RIFOXYA12_FULL_38_20]HBS86355.1 NUDIX hydrolase [Bacteroidales bacterium]